MFDQELILWNDLAGIRGEQKLCLADTIHLPISMTPGALKVLASPIILNLLCLLSDWIEVYLVFDQQASNKCFIFVLLASSSVQFLYLDLRIYFCSGKLSQK